MKIAFLNTSTQVSLQELDYFLINLLVNFMLKLIVLTFFLFIFSAHHKPYIVAVLPRYVEIRTIEPRLMIQSIELSKPRLICQGR